MVIIAITAIALSFALVVVCLIYVRTVMNHVKLVKKSAELYEKTAEFWRENYERANALNVSTLENEIRKFTIEKILQKNTHK